MGKKECIEYIDMPPSLSRQYQNYTKADMTKLFSLKSIEYFGIEEAVEDYVVHYISEDKRW